MFRAHALIVRRAKLYFTVSGIITRIGVMIPETVYYNFCPPDNEHMCSKHVEA